MITVYWYHINYFTLSAIQENADAQNNLGKCYEYGIGVIKNTDTAINYYMLAANQGHVEAQNNLDFLSP